MRRRRDPQPTVDLKLRIPKMLHQELVEQAKKNIRSLNSEIIYRLMESFL